MTEDLVSVVIPTYGEGTYLKRAIDSVINQSYPYIEIIVVDDNGIESENHKKILEIMEVYKGDSRIKLISHEVNKNGSAARNTGVRESNGKYIALLDDDDAFHIDNIKNQLEALSGLDDSYGLTYCSNEVYEGTQKLSEAHVWRDGYVFEHIFTATIEICTSSLLVKKTAYCDIGGFDESFRRHQDLEFLVRMTNKFKAKPVDYIGFRRYITRRNSAKKYEQAKAWREHYLNKMEPYIKLLPKKTQKDIYLYQNLDVMVHLIKEHRILKFLKEYIRIHPGYRGILFVGKRLIQYVKRSSLFVNN